MLRKLLKMYYNTYKNNRRKIHTQAHEKIFPALYSQWEFFHYPLLQLNGTSYSTLIF